MGEAIGPDEGRGHACRQAVVATFGERPLSTDDRAVLGAGTGWAVGAVDARESWVTESLSGDGAVEGASLRATGEAAGRLRQRHRHEIKRHGGSPVHAPAHQEDDD